jgi:hypothetical protein
MNTIEKSLTEIQKNLEKLESARNQVLDVTKSSKEISELMIDLVKSIKEVQVIISGESDSFIKGFVKNEKKVDDAVKAIIDKWQFSISSFDKSLNMFLEKQNTANNNNISNIESFDNSLNEFKNSLIKFDFYSQIKPVESKIEEFEKTISKKIQEINLPVRIDNLNANISAILLVIKIVQGRISDIESKIDSNILELAIKQTDLINELRKDIQAEAKKQHKYIFITWCIILVFGFILIVCK